MSCELSSTGSSCSSLSWAAKEDGEFEVARVLAKLGNAVVGETDDGGGGGGGSGGGGESIECDNVNNNNNNSNNSIWGSKGKRSSKRVKTESETDPAVSSGLGLDLGLGLSSTVPLPFDLNVDQAALYQEECDNRSSPNVDVKFEEVCESANPGPARCAPQAAGRSRQNLTESEKEARRIRRVLANRESARQTIRRRQAMYEELIQKAANLASENENLKRSKELAVKEFQSLQSTNQTLKEQMSQISGENQGDEAKPSSSSDVIDTQSLLSANWPFFVYNTPSSAFTLPSCSYSQLNLCQFSKENDHNAPAGWCILPYPWILPTPPKNTTKNGGVDHEGDLVDGQTIPSPSSIIPGLGNRSWGLPDNAKAGSGGNHIGNSPNREGQRGEPKASRRFVKVSRKKVDATVGAEARKRRRELMKLKSLHCHTFR